MSLLQIAGGATLVIAAGLAMSAVPQTQSRRLPTAVQFVQQGPKLVGSGAISSGPDYVGQGRSVSLSADGNTALVGGPYDNNYVGAAWVWTRTGGVWSQQGQKLVGSGVGTYAYQGWSVALSADGNTAAVGGPQDVDDGSEGSVWIWIRTGGTWSQQGPKLRAAAAYNQTRQGSSVSLSSDGNTLVVGGPGDDSGRGAAWIWTRSGDVWTQVGPKLVGSGAVGNAAQGSSVALSSDGNTAIVGGPRDSTSLFLGLSFGAAWVWTWDGATWNQQGNKLFGSDSFFAFQGTSVSLSADGNTAIVGGPGDIRSTLPQVINVGAAWVWTRSGTMWVQQGMKLVGSGAVWPTTGYGAYQGVSVSLSADGNTALVGGSDDNNKLGATWVWKRSGNVWSQEGEKLVGRDGTGAARQGSSVSLSADGLTALVGGYQDDSAGAAWVFAPQSPFTDDPLTAGVSTIEAVHILELRARVEALRMEYGLGTFPWTDPTLTSGMTLIKAQHILDLRQALSEAYEAAGQPAPTYTDPALVAGTLVKAIHITELRAAVLQLEGIAP